MTSQARSFALVTLLLAAVSAYAGEADIVLKPASTARFVIYGDIRFTNPENTSPSDPQRRKMLVNHIAGERPAFVAITGDLVLNGSSTADWSVFDAEIAPLKSAVPIFPVLGNHDLRGNLQSALKNYFQRFPALRNRRWYSMQFGSAWFFMLDSSADQVDGDEWKWLRSNLASLPADAKYVFFLMHHPPITRSSDRMFGGGHSARPQEQKLMDLIEGAQTSSRAHFLVFSGHVHNYERYEHGGVEYIVSGGGGATPYMVDRQPGDHYDDPGPTYHYCRLTITPEGLKGEMVKMEPQRRAAGWSVRDSFELSAGASTRAQPAGR